MALLKNNYLELHQIIKGMIDELDYKKTLELLIKTSVILKQKKSYSLKKIHNEELNKINSIVNQIYKNEQTGNCVSIALLIFYDLVRYGYSPILCIGINTSDEKLIGHMWVECDGVIFDLPNNIGKFIKTDSINEENILNECIR